MSVRVYILLLVVVGMTRLVEIRISRRNQRRLAAKGVAKVSDRHFRWMVLFHIAILVSAGLEVVVFDRPLLPALALIVGLLFILATGLRWWVIHVMSEHWNVQVMASTGLGVVSHGPFRWIRHPNYAAVFVELIALPLIHTAWVTALIGGALHGVVLRQRLKVEEPVLLSDSTYAAIMGAKPRFLPRLFRTGTHSSSEEFRRQA